jgi:hypothetical protein
MERINAEDGALRPARGSRGGQRSACLGTPPPAECHDDGTCSVAWCSARDFQGLDSGFCYKTGRLAGVLIRIGQEAISDAWLGDQVSRPAGMRLQLAA